MQAHMIRAMNALRSRQSMRAYYVDPQMQYETLDALIRISQYTSMAMLTDMNPFFPAPFVPDVYPLPAFFSLRAPQPGLGPPTTTSRHCRKLHFQAREYYNIMPSIVRIRAIFESTIYLPFALRPASTAATASQIPISTKTSPASLNRDILTHNMSTTLISLSAEREVSSIQTPERWCAESSVTKQIEHALRRVHEILPATASQADFHRKVRLVYSLSFHF